MTEIKDIYEAKAKLQQKKNALRKALYKKGVVAKDKTNEFDRYKYFSEAGYKKLFTELFSNAGLELTSTIAEVERFNVESKDKTLNGRLVRVVFGLYDIETGYGEESVFYGEGYDKGDKGLYKAYTGALKYYLANTFMVATGDDPEVESPEGKEVYKNPEVEQGTYRRLIDDYFIAFPEQLDTFFKKYKITYLDELDSKVSKKKIDSMLTVMKTKLAEKRKTGMFSQEATF